MEASPGRWLSLKRAIPGKTMMQSEGILPPRLAAALPLFASRSSWEDSHVTHAGISLKSLCGQAVSGLLDSSRPLDEQSFCSWWLFLAPVPHLLAGGLCALRC